MKNKIEILSGVRTTRIIYKFGETQMVRELEENLDGDMYISPISKKDFELTFNFQDPNKQLLLFENALDQHILDQDEKDQVN